MTPRTKPHWVVKSFNIIEEGECIVVWSAQPSRPKWLPDFKPYFLLTKEEFDRNLRKDLPALLGWLAWAYPETSHWPVLFLTDEHTQECGREVIK